MLHHLGDQSTAIEVRKRLTPLHIIGIALIAGVCTFAIIAWQTAPVGSLPGNVIMMLRYAWGAMALSELPVMFILRQAMLGRAALLRRNAPPADGSSSIDDAVFMIFRGWSILALAIPESLALFGCVIMLLSGEALDGLLVAAPVLAMLAVFPTSGRWLAFNKVTQERAAIGR